MLKFNRLPHYRVWIERYTQINQDGFHDFMLEIESDTICLLGLVNEDLGHWYPVIEAYSQDEFIEKLILSLDLPMMNTTCTVYNTHPIHTEVFLPAFESSYRLLVPTYLFPAKIMEGLHNDNLPITFTIELLSGVEKVRDLLIANMQPIFDEILT
jgi:hypothetical protein